MRTFEKRIKGIIFALWHRGISLCIIILLLSFSSKCEIAFETQHIKNTFNALSSDLQETIINIPRQGERTLKISDILENGELAVRFNENNELSHIGLQINTSDQGVKQLECELFLENLVLNIFLADERSFIHNYIKNNGIEIYKSNKPYITKSASERHELVRELLATKMILQYNESLFSANWVLNIGATLSIRFPANIYLIKGMDKTELEIDFLRAYDSFNYTSLPSKIDKSKTTQADNGLILFNRSKFGADDFHSDVYLKKDNSGNLKPVFSEQYPIESLSNLFLFDLGKTHPIQATFILYPYRKESRAMELGKLTAFLRQNEAGYFGLSSITPDSIHATVIYYDPLYNYVNMILVEANRWQLFSNNPDPIKITFYLYIPRDDLKSGAKKDNTFLIQSSYN